MNTENINVRHSWCELLDKARRVLNDASATRADVLSCKQYREAEILYAQALQRFIVGELTTGEALAKEALGRALEARQYLVAHKKPIAAKHTVQKGKK